MKTLIALISCLTLTVGFASADQHKKKGKHADDAQATPQGAPQGGNNPKKGGKGHHQMQNVGQQNANVGTGGQSLQSKKFLKQNETQLHGGNANMAKGIKAEKFARHPGKHEFKQFKLAKDKAPSNIPNVKFQANNHIKGAHNWKGQKYVVFKNYKSEWHDKHWWHHHHNKIVFVLGGWYFWDAGYYYPAWGYAPDAYYAYDGPIYTGSVDRDPGDVVANVQSALQEQGYNVGAIDGVLGPQTRAALAEYQQAQGIEPTGAIDEPTLESMGMV